MIKFFRRIRFDLMKQNKTGKYFKYAIGEIILVVIGILIALQINNWNESVQNKKKESEYLVNLLQDLKSDSLQLNSLVNTFKTAVNSKKVFESLANGNRINTDSIQIHFLNQLDFLIDFVPNSTTVDELKNSGNLNLITNTNLRRQLVSLNNQYASLQVKLELGVVKRQEIIDIVSHQVKNITLPTKEEISALMSTPYFPNKMRLNYLFTQFTASEQAYHKCKETIELIKKELK